MVRALSIAIAVQLSASVSCKADDFGCTVLMCLSNPAGWSAAPACVAPVTQMLSLLRSNNSFSCDAVNGTKSNVTISQGRKWYDRWIAYTDSAGTPHRDYF